MSNKPSLRDHRFKVMEGVLAWEGEIGNARVRQLFDIQPVQASRLLAEFKSLMEGRIIEDGRAKVVKSLAPEGIETSVTLESYARYVLSEEGRSRCVIDARVNLSEPAPAVFATVRKAALSKAGVLIRYASMANPDFAERKIFPHSIVHVGRRWHVRAWCAKRSDFRDFTMGRIASAAPVAELAPMGIENDAAWQRQVELDLIAHRRLSAAQQKLVMVENFDGCPSRRISVPACLVQYVVQDLRAALDPELETPPAFQLEVANACDLGGLLFQEGA